MNEWEKYVGEWKSRTVLQWGEMTVDSMLDFVLKQSGLENSERAALAEELIVEDFLMQRRNGGQVWIQRQLEVFSTPFLSAGISLDTSRLTEKLIEADILTSEHYPNKQKLQSIFEEHALFIEECFLRQEETFLRRFPDMFRSEIDGAHESDRIQVMDEYKIVRKISSGAEKVVYEVVQPKTGQLAVMKVLAPDCSNGFRSRTRMASEAFIQAKIVHPNVPVLFSLTNSSNGNPVLVEQMIPGECWSSLIGKMTMEENLEILLHVAQVMACIHDKYDVIHGDLKPENIIVYRYGAQYRTVHIVDWGMAVCLSLKPEKDEQELGGTACYLPPEVVQGRFSALSLATDVFMLGGILYKILTSSAPYEQIWKQGGTLSVISKAGVHSIPPLPSVSPVNRQKIPGELAYLVRKSLRYEPKKRFSDAGEFAKYLGEFIEKKVPLEFARADQTNEYFSIHAGLCGP